MDQADDWNLFADYSRFRQHPVRFVQDFRKMMGGSDFAEYQDYIGCRLYDHEPDWYSAVKKRTFAQPLLKSCINKLVSAQLLRETKAGIIKNDTDRAERERRCRLELDSLLEGIASNALPSFSRISGTRFSYFFVSQTLSRGYRQGMHVSRFEVERLRAKARELAPKKQSIILFPCHKSHCDYIALVYAFFRIGLSLPSTIAGDNLDIPLVSWFLRQVGATFIRRGNWRDDPLYTAFFQSLVNTYLQMGVNMQCFIEGTRSRTGKLLPPKFGIMKFITEAIASGAAEDCWIVPVSTQYDKAMEHEAYATELMGKEKKSESFMSFLDARNMFKVDLGRIDIRIGEGFSLKQFLNQHTKIPQRVVLRTFAYKVLHDINSVSVVMPSALVGTVLLTTRQRGLSEEDLVLRVRLLMNRIVHRGGHIGTISKPESELSIEETRKLVNVAIDVLGPDLVEIEKKRLLEPVCHSKDEFKLSYYRNQVVHLFVAEALVCVALYQHCMKYLTLEVPLSELKETVLFLSKTLSGEFVFNNDFSLVENLQDTLGVLCEQRIISSFDDNAVQVNPQEVRDDWAFTHFYCYLVWPYIDGYWSVAMTMLMMPTNVSVNLKQFFTVAQQVGNTFYTEGALSHIEACNRQLVLSAVQQAEARGKVKLSRNSITLVSSREAVYKVCEKLSSLRNEVMKRPQDSLLMQRIEKLGSELLHQARL